MAANEGAYILNSIFKFLLNLFSVIGFVFTVISGWGQTSAVLVKVSTQVFSPLTVKYLQILTPSLTFIFLMSIYFLYYRTQIIVFFKSNFLPNHYLAHYIHEFEHLIDEGTQRIKVYKGADDNFSLDDDRSRKIILELLDQIRKTLSQLNDKDINVHIKLPFLRDGDHATTYTNIESIYLKAYERSMSDYERKMTISENEDIEAKLLPRSKKERFAIKIDGDPQWIRSHTNCTKTYKCNSAYNSVLGSGKHSWISNNLIKTKEKDQYCSTSKNWQIYYESMAVAAIAPHQANSHGEIDDSFGIIIADSGKINAFNRKLTIQLMGYYAHRLYRLLTLIAT